MKILPKTATNSLNKKPYSFYVYMLYTLIIIGRSGVHFFKDDGGKESIAKLPVSEDKICEENMMNVWRQWGAQQLSMGLVYLLVGLKYRSLIPLMCIFMYYDYFTRLGVGHFQPLNMGDTEPPGKKMNIIFFLFPTLILVLVYLGY